MILDTVYEGFDAEGKRLEENQLIHMWCENKGVIVSAPLTQDLSTSISNQWSDYFQGGVFGAAFNILDQVSDFSLAWKGVSLHQPYMSRKMWKGTSPLSFQLDFNFVAIKDAKTDVVDKVNAIAVMATPHKGEYKNESRVELEKYIDSITDETDLSVGEEKMSKVTKTIMEMTDLVAQKWVTPGPSVLASDIKSHEDAPITVMLPMYGTLENCYIENLAITTSKSLDINGNPLGAKVSVKISRMDSIISMKDSSGKFSVPWEYNYENDSVKKLAELVGKLTDVGREYFFGTYERLGKLMSGGSLSDDPLFKKMFKGLIEEVDGMEG